MMPRHLFDPISSYAAGFAALFALVAFALGGIPVGAGVLVGAAVALINWKVLRWIVGRLLIGAGSEPAVSIAGEAPVERSQDLDAAPLHSNGDPPPRTHVYRAQLGVLVFLKMMALVGICWVLIAQIGVHPIGFAVGITSCVAALFMGAGTGLSAGTAGEEG